MPEGANVTIKHHNCWQSSAEEAAIGSIQGSPGRCEVSSSQASVAVLWLLRPSPKAATSRKSPLLLLSSELVSTHPLLIPS